MHSTIRRKRPQTARVAGKPRVPRGPDEPHDLNVTGLTEREVAALDVIVRSGRARYIGASSMYAWQFMQLLAHQQANGLARFRQKRDGHDEYFEGEAERIDYDSRSEKAEFFNRAWVRSGLDEVRGQYISYDGINESYLATTGGSTKVAGTAGQSRVRAIIQPKSKGKSETNPAAQKGEPLVLKPAANVTPRTD
jgi:lipopolysaccharide transport protein LptA